MATSTPTTTRTPPILTSIRIQEWGRYRIVISRPNRYPSTSKAHITQNQLQGVASATAHLDFHRRHRQVLPLRLRIRPIIATQLLLLPHHGVDLEIPCARTSGGDRDSPGGHEWLRLLDSRQCPHEEVAILHGRSEPSHRIEE